VNVLASALRLLTWPMRTPVVTNWSAIEEPEPLDGPEPCGLSAAQIGRVRAASATADTMPKLRMEDSRILKHPSPRGGLKAADAVIVFLANRQVKWTYLAPS